MIRDKELLPCAAYFDYSRGDDLREFVQYVRDHQDNYHIHVRVGSNRYYDFDESLAVYCMPKRF